MVVDDVLVNAEVGHWVVDVISTWSLLMFVLGAASRGADWIGLLINLNVVWFVA